MANTEDIVQRFERWEKCMVAGFVLFIKAIGLGSVLVAVLSIEVAMAVKVWDNEIVGRVAAQSVARHGCPDELSKGTEHLMHTDDHK